MKRTPRLVSISFVLLTFVGSLLPALNAQPDIAKEQARSSPEWVRSGIIYQIFVRSFSHEGNLQGVDKRLDDLHKLGVNILWLMPIHPSGQAKKKGSLGSPYSVRDYYAVDPSLGTKEDLKRLVRDAHTRQIKVIIDMVANHTAWDSVMMSDPDFYKKDKQGNITYPYDWTDVAALDYSNPKLRRYMLDMLAYWIKEFDLDGYRCDAAGEIPTDFWEQARTELDAIKPDILMLAEGSKPELMRKAFNLDYAWPLLHTFEAVIMQGEPATALHETTDQQRAKFPKGTIHMQVIDDHDELRAVTQFGFPGTIAAAAVMLTLDGVPLLYNGMEVGDSTQSRSPALFEPQKIFWEASDWHSEYPKFYAAMDALRREHSALQQGELHWLHNSDEQHVVSYVRQSPDEEFLIAVNLSNTPFRGTVEAETGNWAQVALPLSETAATALPFLSLDAFHFRVFRKQR